MDKEISNTIVVNLKETDIYSQFGYENKEQIDRGVVQTVRDLADARPIKERLTLLVKKPQNSTLDKTRFSKAYGNTISSLIDMKKHEVKRCVATGLVLFLLSIAILALNVFVLASVGGLVYEIIHLLGWVLGFVGIEILTIELIQLLIEIKKYRRIRAVEIRLDGDK